MENPKILSHDALLQRISHLKGEKSFQETLIKQISKELVLGLNPISIVKKHFHDLAQDTELRFDLGKIGMNIGSNLLIDTVLGKNRSIKGFVSSVVAETFSNSFINNNFSKIFAGIGNFFKRKPTQEILISNEKLLNLNPDIIQLKENLNNK